MLIALALLGAQNLTQAETETKPQRIQLARGANGTTLRGHLSRNQAEQFYRVRVRAGQKMSLKVSAPPHPIDEGIVPMIFITSPSGQRTSDKITRYDTLKTEAGDYLIRVAVNQMATNGTQGDFFLKVWIR